MKIETFDDLVPQMRRAGVVATVLSAIITAKFGWQQGEDFISGVAYAGLLALCTFIVGYGLVATYHACKRKMYVIGMAAFTVFAIAAIVEFTSHTGFNAANKGAVIQAASFQTLKADYATDGVVKKNAMLQNLLDERSVMKPKASPGEAEAVVANAEAHKFWKRTGGCKETKGSQTRKFCDSYNSALADIAMWSQIGVLETKITEAEMALTEAKSGASVIEAGFSAMEAQNATFASAATGNDKPTVQARYWANMGLSALLALAAVTFACLINLVAYSFETGVRKVASGVAEVMQDLGTTNNRPLINLAGMVGHLNGITGMIEQKPVSFARAA